MIRTTALAVSVVLSAIFSFVAFDNYLSRISCFNEVGRCFDEQTGVVHLEQSGMVWLTLAAVSIGLTLYQMWRWKFR